jgi:hypothetical protein
MFRINPPQGVAQVDAIIGFSAVFTVDQVINLNLATWVWGDGSRSTCPPDSAVCSIDAGAASVADGEASGSQLPTVGKVLGSHKYNEPGVYTVQLTLRDKFGQFDTSTYEFVVVYDPSGGYVTGGGWINSQDGAYKPAPSLTGKATFGFVSEYKKGATVPTGNTEFQFKTADLNFHSDTYQWLVVNQNGTNAQFKGNGTINGVLAPSGENYQFMIWATDGEPDTFRIKIWYMDGVNMFVVYDNGFRQPIDGGDILVHKGKNQ